jgi:hypothetical protein
MPLASNRKGAPRPRFGYAGAALVGFLVSTGAAIAQGTGSGIPGAALDRLAADANIVFVGTVMGPASADAAVETRVETALRSPEQLGPLDGTVVTLVQGQDGGLSADDRYIFFTQTQLLGERLTLREIGRVRVAAAEALSKELQESDQRLERSQLTARLEAADAVVVGRVTDVQRDIPAPSVPVSEHDPQWMRATIEIEDVLAGALDAKEFVLVFPGTMDIAWVGVARPKQGQQAVWLLTADPELGGYKALDPRDVQPLQRTDEIRRLLQPLK